MIAGSLISSVTIIVTYHNRIAGWACARLYGVLSVPKLVVITLFINDVVHLYMGRLIYK